MSLKRAASERLRSSQSKSADYEKTRQHPRSEAPPKPVFSCHLESMVSEFYSSPGAHTWPGTVRASASLCTQKPQMHMQGTSGNNTCPFCVIDSSLPLRDREHSLHTARALIEGCVGQRGPFKEPSCYVQSIILKTA